MASQIYLEFTKGALGTAEYKKKSLKMQSKLNAG